MPYAIEMADGQHQVVVHPKTKKRKVLGSHPTHEQAVKQLQAIHANEMKKHDRGRK